jgi:lysyl-tRNA synthetase class 2
MATLRELRDERLRKVEELKKLGIDPYPATSHRTNALNEITNNFDQLNEQQVSVVGRILNIRKFGKIAFIVIKDQTGSLQLFLSEADVAQINLSEDKSRLGFSELNLLDSGDFIEASGAVIKTQTGEISVNVKNLRILTKSLRPLPQKQDGFTNKEERLRRRYVDMNVNQEVRQRFIRRSRFWGATREFFDSRGYTEVNVPILEHTTGGADATPFITHMDAIDQDFFLRISHELPLKRLIGGGFEKVYDIGPRFRNENYSDEHLPEHVAMESYTAFQDFDEGIAFYEGLMKYVAKETWGTLKLKANGYDVDLEQPWPRVKYAEIMMEKYGVDVFNPDLDHLKQILKDNKVDLGEESGINMVRALDNVWKLIRRTSSGPFWLILEPIQISPLAKSDTVDPRLSLRFHPVIAGTEMGNGYAELNDPVDQLNRFKSQQELRDSGDSEAQMLDIDFVEMLEYGMPPTCGWGYSERFFWAFEGVSAREGVPFPQLRFEIDEVTKTIYPDIFKSN